MVGRCSGGKGDFFNHLLNTHGASANGPSLVSGWGFDGTGAMDACIHRGGGAWRPSQARLWRPPDTTARRGDKVAPPPVPSVPIGTELLGLHQ